MKETQTILIVDDSPTIRKSLFQIIKKSNLFSNIIFADNGVKALEFLLKEKCDFIISDLMMPKLDGYKLLIAIRSNDQLKDIPFILLTNQKNSYSKIKGLNIGASDYVTKPFDTGELLARIGNLLKTKELQKELLQKNLQLEQLNKKLEELSITDELTLLFNRRYFNERLSKEFQKSKINQAPLACMLLDLDHFKLINDTYGHDQGDNVLKEVARMLKSICSEQDVAARYGGEEFILYLCNTHTQEAVKVANRLRFDIESFPFCRNTGNILSATASIGVVGLPQPLIHNHDELVKWADDALYTAKRSGRNKVIGALGEGGLLKQF